MWQFFLIFTLLIIWFILDYFRYSKYPPGPLRFPIVGNLIQIARISQHPGIAFQTLANQYGPIVYARMGTANTIICNTIETIQFIRNHEHCTNRAQQISPAVWERNFEKNIGLIWANGKDQQILRRFTIRTLREFGFEKAASMDAAIDKELEQFIDHLHILVKNQNGFEDVTQIFNITVTNIIWGLLTGNRYDLNDEGIKKLLHLSHELIRSISMGMSASMAFPFLFTFFPNMMGKTQMKKIMTELKTFIQEVIDRHRNTGNFRTNPKGYLDIFLGKIEEKVGKADETTFTDEQLIMSLLDLFQAASDTTSNTLAFCMLYMLAYPEVQSKVRQEIEENISLGEKNINYSMRDKLPFTSATVLECTRHASAVPTSNPHIVEQDFYYKGYIIKKGVHVIPNLYAVHMSKQIWGDPQNFRPTRFLDNNGQLDKNVTSNVIPFSVGPRMCLGVGLAESTIFSYFATILKHFYITKVSEQDEPSTFPKVGMTLSPQPFGARFVPIEK